MAEANSKLMEAMEKLAKKSGRRCVSLNMPILTYDKKLKKIQDMKTGEMLFNPKTNSSEMFLGTSAYYPKELVNLI